MLIFGLAECGVIEHDRLSDDGVAYEVSFAAPGADDANALAYPRPERGCAPGLKRFCAVWAQASVVEAGVASDVDPKH